MLAGIGGGATVPDADEAAGTGAGAAGAFAGAGAGAAGEEGGSAVGAVGAGANAEAVGRVGSVDEKPYLFLA